MRRFSLPLPAAWSRLFLTGCVALALVGCNNEPKKVELPAPPAPLSVTAEPAVSGELADLLAIVPGSYQVSVAPYGNSMDGYKLTAKVKVRFIQAKDIPTKDDNGCCGPELMARLLDESGAPLDKFDRLSDNNTRTQLAGMIKRGKGEEWLTFSTQLFASGEEAKAEADQWLAALQQAKKIGLVSSVSVADANEEKAAPATTSASSADSNGDCDAFLEGYEEYVDDYVALAKEMQENPSDATLLAKSSALSMKAASWASKAQGCQDDAAFQAKYMALSARMAAGM